MTKTWYRIIYQNKKSRIVKTDNILKKIDFKKSVEVIKICG